MPDLVLENVPQEAVRRPTAGCGSSSTIGGRGDPAITTLKPNRRSLHLSDEPADGRDLCPWHHPTARGGKADQGTAGRTAPSRSSLDHDRELRRAAGLRIQNLLTVALGLFGTRFGW